MSNIHHGPVHVLDEMPQRQAQSPGTGERAQRNPMYRLLEVLRVVQRQGYTRPFTAVSRIRGTSRTLEDTRGHEDASN